MRYEEGTLRYELTFAGKHVERMVRTYAAGRMETAVLPAAATRLEEGCGQRVALPVRSRRGLRWLDEQGAVVVIEQVWGWRNRNWRNLYPRASGVNDVVGARTHPSPGAHMRGDWTDGYYHRRTLGKWRVTDADGAVESGTWAKGAPVGRWTVTRPDGVVRESGHYVAGRPTGVWTCRDDDGSRRERGYDRGRKSGVWRTWNADGLLLSERTEVPDESEPALRGRLWEGGLLRSKKVASPCAVEAPLAAPLAALAAELSEAVPAGFVEVRVVDDSLLEIPGATVEVLSVDAIGPTVVASGATDEGGGVRLGPLPVGTYRLRVRKYYFTPMAGALVIAEGASGVVVRVTLE